MKQSIEVILILVVFTKIVTLNAVLTKMKLLVPLFMNPRNDSLVYWQQAANATSKVNVISLFLAPDSTQPEYKSLFQDYVKALIDLKKQNQKNNGSYVIAYVDTRYGDRALSSVQADILKLSTWPLAYRPDGIFYDGSFDDTSKLNYFDQVYDYVKSAFKNNNTLVVASSDAAFRAEYFCSAGIKNNKTCLGKRALDIGLIFEDSYNNWENNGAGFEPFVKSLNRTQLAAIVYNCSTVDAMKEIINDANKSNIGYVYVTDQGYDANAIYNRLPTYFQDEVDFIASLK